MAGRVALRHSESPTPANSSRKSIPLLVTPAEPAAGHSRSTKAVTGVFWSGINIVVPSLASLLVFVVVSRLLTPVDFGVAAAAAALAAGASALVPSGFGDALVQRMEKEPLALDTVFWFCVCCAIAMYGLLVALRHEIAIWFHIPALSGILPVLGLRVIWDAAAVVPTAIITQSLSFQLIAVRTMVATLVSALISLILVLLGWGFWALAISMLANSFVAAVAVFWGAGWIPQFQFNRKVIFELSGYGAFASGTRLLSYVGTQVDQAFVGLVLGTFQLGLYNFARRVFSLLNDVTSGALNAVAHPLFAGIKDDRDRVKRGFLMASFLSSMVAFPCFIGLACVAHLAIPLLFGPQWTGALWPIRILCALGIVSCIGMLQAGLITSVGRANWWFYYQLVTGLSNIPIIIFVSPYGTTALVIAVTAKAYLLWFIPVTMTLKILSMRASSYLVQFLPALGAAFAMAFSIAVADAVLKNVPKAVAFPTEVLIGGVTYSLVLFAFAHNRVLGIVDVLRGAVLRRPSKIDTSSRVPG